MRNFAFFKLSPKHASRKSIASFARFFGRSIFFPQKLPAQAMVVHFKYGLVAGHPFSSRLFKAWLTDLFGSWIGLRFGRGLGAAHRCQIPLLLAQSRIFSLDRYAAYNWYIDVRVIFLFLTLDADVFPSAGWQMLQWVCFK